MSDLPDEQLAMLISALSRAPTSAVHRMPFRGMYFSTWKDDGHSLLVKSFPKASVHFDCSMELSDTPALIQPVCKHGSRRIRHFYSIPMGALRLVEMDLAFVDSSYAEPIAAAYLGAATLLDTNEFAHNEAPRYCRFMSGNTIAPAIQQCLRADEALRQRLLAARRWLAESPDMINLHGSFSVGNTFYGRGSHQAHLLNDHASFRGPVEYDLATFIETFIDLLNKRELQKKDCAATRNFIGAILGCFKNTFEVDMEKLRHMTLYQYVGHLNLFSLLRSNKGINSVPLPVLSGLISSFTRTLDRAL